MPVIALQIYVEVFCDLVKQGPPDRRTLGSTSGFLDIAQQNKPAIIKPMIALSERIYNYVVIEFFRATSLD